MQQKDGGGVEADGQITGGNVARGSVMQADGSEDSCVLGLEASYKSKTLQGALQFHPLISPMHRAWCL